MSKQVMCLHGDFPDACKYCEIDDLQADINQLRTERDAALARVEEIKDEFVKETERASYWYQRWAVLEATNGQLRLLVGELVECIDDELVCTRACHWYDELEERRGALLARAKEVIK